MSFFFSSRRRHTRSLRDWSSDVCSSDLLLKNNRQPRTPSFPSLGRLFFNRYLLEPGPQSTISSRSEERRVGKECKLRVVQEQIIKNPGWPEPEAQGAKQASRPKALSCCA